MNWVDIAIITIIILSVITGLIRGLIKEIIAFSVWLLAFWVAYHYSYQLEPLINKYIHDANITKLVAFISFFVGTLVAGGLVNALLGFILKRSGLSGTDRLLGMGFGFTRGVFIVSFLMLMVQITAIPENYSRQSVLYPKFQPIVQWMSGFTPRFLEEAKSLSTATTHPKEQSESPPSNGPS